jgi:hypothetical protein
MCGHDHEPGSIVRSRRKNQRDGAPDDVDITLTIAGVAYTGNANCPANLIGAHADGSLTGGYTLKAFNGATSVTLTSD